MAPPFNSLEAVAYSLEQLQGYPERIDWCCRYFFVRPDAMAPRASQTLIGIGGFHVSPNAAGCVELSYSILQSSHRRGYGTQAIQGLVEPASA